MTASSQFPPTDDLDRLIDDVARRLVAGQPQRVSAATIRAAIAAAPAPRSALPVWLSLAAVLLVGFLVMLTRAPDQARSSDRVATSPAPIAQPVSSPVMLESHEERERAGVRQTTARPQGAAAESPSIHEPYEGLPRLIIPVIEQPEALATTALVQQRLEIPRIDIAPLQLSALDHEQP
ncbi:MAG: hypothetical protein ABIR28_12545 [Vicinamibacteria bacterium]